MINFEDIKMTMAVNRVVFLDMDGPMIPNSMFLLHKDASYGRHFSPVSVAWLNKLCSDAQAVVVTNSYHNSDDHMDTYNLLTNQDGLYDVAQKKSENLYDAMLRNGMKKHFLHPSDWKTDYPGMKPRHKAVQNWLVRHPEVTNYCALDDDPDFNNDYVVQVDPDVGVQYDHYKKAYTLLTGRHPKQLFHW